MTEPTPKDNFELAEFNALKQEINQQSSQQAQLERQVLLGIAVLYAVLATLSQYKVEPTIQPLTRLIWFAPTVLILIVWLRWECYRAAIAQIGNHIKRYPYQTWETSPDKKKIWQYILLGYTWLVLGVLSLAAAVWFSFLVSPEEAQPEGVQNDTDTSRGNDQSGGQAQAGADEDLVRILARWTQLIPPSKACGGRNPNLPGGQAAGCTPKILVRAIIEQAGDCSKVALRDGAPVSMQTRNRPEGASEEDFAVKVCEVLLDLDDKEIEFADGGKLTWTDVQKLEEVAVVGDTGCNPRDGQTCKHPSWPFAAIADRAAGRPVPDLVIHVGDYRYRGGSSGDNWDNWQKDFFAPAEALLRAAPWIMARGNHESCYDKQGPGWFYFLEPQYQYVSKCPAAAGEDETDNLPPYAIDLGESGSHGPSLLRLIVLDSTNAKYQCRRWAEQWTEVRGDGSFAGSFEDFIHASRAQDTWIITHYPVWDVSAHFILDEDPDRNRYLHCEGGYYNAQSVHKYRKLLASAIESPTAKKMPSVVLSGDTHHFQVLRVHDADPTSGRPSEKSDHPLQFVAGHGGTLLTPGLGASGPDPDKLFEDTCERPDHSQVAYFQRGMNEFGGNGTYWLLGKAVCRYGSLAAEYEDDGWHFALRGVDDPSPSAATSCLQATSGRTSCYHDHKVRSGGGQESEKHCVKLGGGEKASAAARQCEEFAGEASLSP